MSYEIRELSLGGVLDQAINIVKDHFGLLLKIMLIVIVPFTILVGLVTLAKMPTLPAEPTPEDYRVYQEAVANSLFVTLPLSLIGGLIIYPLANAAVIHAVGRLYLGEEVTAGGAIRQGLSRLGPLIGTTFLMGLIIMFGYMLLIIPGIYFSIWYGLGQHVTVLEEKSGMDALRRSKELVNPKRGQFLALGIIIFALSFGINSIANFITEPYVGLVVGSLLQACTTSIWTAALVVFYFSCRCKVENFDLQLLAENLGAEAPPEASPAM